jgi:hypothetical protein
VSRAGLEQQQMGRKESMMNDPWEGAGSYWWQIPVDTNVGLLAMPIPPNNQLGDSPWARDSGTVTSAPSSLQNPSVLRNSGLLPMLNRGPNQGVAPPPSETNGGFLGSLGRAVIDTSRNPWGTVSDTALSAVPMRITPEPWATRDSLLGYRNLLVPLTAAQFEVEGGSEPVPTARKTIDEAECNAMHQRDLFHCRMVGLSACYAQANLRWANCLAGKQIPPLNY